MAYNRNQHVLQMADAICEDLGYDSYRALDEEDIEYIAIETQCNYEGVCEILNIPLPAALKPVRA